MARGFQANFFLFSRVSFFQSKTQQILFNFRSSSNRKMELDTNSDDEGDVDDSENGSMQNSDSSVDLEDVSQDETIKARDIVANNPIAGVQSSSDQYFAKEKKGEKNENIRK